MNRPVNVTEELDYHMGSMIANAMLNDVNTALLLIKTQHEAAKDIHPSRHVWNCGFARETENYLLRHSVGDWVIKDLEQFMARRRKTRWQALCAAARALLKR